MNVGVVVAGMVILAAVIIGVAGITNYHSQPVSDTFGNTYSNETNQSMAAGQAVTYTSIDIGGIGVIVLSVIFVCATLVAVLGLIFYRGGYYSSTRR